MLAAPILLWLIALCLYGHADNNGCMDTALVEQALERLGQRFSYHTEVELVLVGGAAGMLTGVLPASRTTLDCDVMAYLPEQAMPAVEQAAEWVAREMGLSAKWLNSDVQIRRDALPLDWKTRRVWIGAWGRLRVFAVSRVDLIAMKVLAGRGQDIEDIRSMRPRTDELDFVRRYLGMLADAGTLPAQIDDARTLLGSLEGHGRE